MGGVPRQRVCNTHNARMLAVTLPRHGARSTSGVRYGVRHLFQSSGVVAYGPCVKAPPEPHAVCAVAEGHWLPGASSRLEARSPSSAGRSDGRGEDRGSPVELSRATRLSRLARPMSEQRHFVARLYTLSRDTTAFWVTV